MNYIIYKITNLINGKIYIGKTTRTIERRWSQHCYCKSIDHIHNAIRKYGKENFKIEIICVCNDESELSNKEIEIIAQFGCRDREIGYNICPGGEGFGSGKDHPKSGKKASDETKKKMSKAQSGENHPMFGKHLPDETKKKLSELNTGEKNPFFGKHHSEETKNKMSENHPDITGENNPMYGKNHSDESKRKISKGKSGENNARAKLNWQQVKEIRENKDNLSQKELAEKYNTAPCNISNIISNRAWKKENMPEEIKNGS